MPLPTPVPKSFVFFILFFAVACTQSRVRVYQDALEPLVGSGKREEVDKLLGTPTSCKKPDPTIETCEYRSSYGRTMPVPDVHRQGPGFDSPDLRPYDYFDVLQLDYDAFGVLRNWQIVVLSPGRP